MWAIGMKLSVQRRTEARQLKAARIVQRAYKVGHGRRSAGGAGGGGGGRGRGTMDDIA